MLVNVLIKESNLLNSKQKKIYRNNIEKKIYLYFIVIQIWNAESGDSIQGKKERALFSLIDEDGGKCPL